MKEYFKKLWNAIWASTDLDEKAVAVVKETKTRVKAVKKELTDVVDAAKGKKGKGKKPYKKNKKTKTNNNKSIKK
mgnify:FL=1|jgi:hypothetical protein|tara:strand:- start:402 stop:626 length:225 start_codon:yes stop_codon:yes gene_type:complete